jgi:hypothetical protein
MKKIALACFLLVFGRVDVEAAKILMLGNSLTYGYDATNPVVGNYGSMPKVIQNLALEGGQGNHQIIMNVFSSYTLNNHVAEATSVAAIQSNQWDWVVLQGYSLEPLLNSWGDFNGFLQGASALRSLILANNPATHILFYETWARTDYSAVGYASMQAMHDDLQAGYLMATSLYGDAMAPAGDAFLLSMADNPSINLYSDGVHASPAGYYLTGLVFYATLFQGDPRFLLTGAGSVAAALGLDAVTAQALQQTAYKAVFQAPVAVTAGRDQTVAWPAEATLTGEVFPSPRPTAGSVTSTWSKVSGPGDVHFTDTQAVGTTASFSQVGTYLLRLTASDALSSASNDVQITVVPYGYVPGGDSVRFDFGATATGGNWNNVASSTTGLKISNAIDLNGRLTGIGLSVTAAFTGVNGSGSTSTSGIYPVSAMQDSLYMQNAAVGKVKLQGLNPALKYDLTFFGSRVGGSSNRVGRYTVNGQTVTLNANNNSTTVVKLSSLTPVADGTLEVAVQNHTGSGTGHLSVMEVQAVVANLVPLVQAGSDQVLAWPASATLSGAVYDDNRPTGAAVTQSWSQVSGPGTVSWGQQAQAQTTASFSQPGVYVLRLTANDTLLSGSDEITVIIGMNYGIWKAQYSWNGGGSLDLDDPDGDKIPNLMEYALGLNPMQPSTIGLPSLTVGSSDLTYVYTKDTSKSDLTYQVEYSADLQTWSSAASARVGPAGVTETWQASLPRDAAHKFLRLRVSR